MRGRIHIYGLLALALMLASAGCNLLPKKKTNWNISLRRDDKKPYGSYLAYEGLKKAFPYKKIEVLSQGFRYTSIDNNMTYNGNTSTNVLILLGLDFFISEKEMEQLLYFANNGNEVILFCSKLDNKLATLLGINKNYSGYEEAKLAQFNPGTDNLKALTIKRGTANPYGHNGRSLQGYFTVDSTGERSYGEEDEAISIRLIDTPGFSRDSIGILRFAIGDGHLTVHAAPLTMSNYFLLQKDNHTYLDALWRLLPDNIRSIYWNEYYKHNAEGSDLGVLWRYPATRIALVLALLTLLLYVIFDGKRRQRIVPIITQPENSSVSFVETVGRLYYNKGDHSNLGEKMIQHFLEWVRTHHYLNTNILNSDFAFQLARRTGQPEEKVNMLLNMIHDLRLGNTPVDEPYLYELHNMIQEFYNNHTA